MLCLKTATIGLQDFGKAQASALVLGVRIDLFAICWCHNKCFDTCHLCGTNAGCLLGKAIGNMRDGKNSKRTRLPILSEWGYAHSRSRRQQYSSRIHSMLRIKWSINGLTDAWQFVLPSLTSLAIVQANSCSFFVNFQCIRQVYHAKFTLLVCACGYVINWIRRHFLLWIFHPPLSFCLKEHVFHPHIGEIKGSNPFHYQIWHAYQQPY